MNALKLLGTLLIPGLLLGCATGHPITRGINSVDKYQRYEMPKHFHIEATVLPLGQVIRACGDAYGCVKRVSETEFLFFMVDNKVVADHECEHVIYGPKHEG